MNPLSAVVSGAFPKERHEPAAEQLVEDPGLSGAGSLEIDTFPQYDIRPLSPPIMEDKGCQIC